MAQRIDLKRYNNVNFEYQGNTIRLTRPRWNKYTFCFTTDLTCNDETVYGLTLRCGVDIVRQFGLPFNLYVINSEDITLDPVSFSGLKLYILEKSDAQIIIKGAQI